MSKFKIGDGVRVTTTRFGSYQHGMEGEVFEITDSILPIRVQFTNGTNSYADVDLALCKFKLGQLLPEPEFDLEEIERAERLVHE